MPACHESKNACRSCHYNAQEKVPEERDGVQLDAGRESLEGELSQCSGCHVCSAPQKAAVLPAQRHMPCTAENVHGHTHDIVKAVLGEITEEWGWERGAAERQAPPYRHARLSGSGGRRGENTASNTPKLQPE